MEPGLKQYFVLYLQEVRKVKKTTAAHYIDALNNLSRFLKEKGLVHDDIYEIGDLEELRKIKEILFHDPEFIEYNKRGHQMYSAGINNYFRFAEGYGFGYQKTEALLLLDIPLLPAERSPSITKRRNRSDILRRQTFERAHYECEMDAGHQTFITEADHRPYMEGHHAIPMKLQDRFHYSLDVYANIICLCPVCHRMIHYGLHSDRLTMMNRIYYTRKERLANSGIILSQDEFVKIVG